METVASETLNRVVRVGFTKDSSKCSLNEGEGVSHMDMGRWGSRTFQATYNR